ncbi:SigE family RNA polymerase sigma factor [Plantactinospora sp. KBS50]|uniref:SigE family RNA polymerase sigma factor n=1 Tax=Plantactinospora sp. KBS50 TaxID=2024580 RepID=UPI000BAAA52F|nr:SigE family RNA polymerase sigma factor [Plantactinospora sp. KBS50]ASW56918.1 SigE family RNA polymerase sigma factor [Plantactinospora sp. KBS50]
MADDGFREFVEVRYADLLRTAYLLTGSRHAAEDLVQSALIRAMRRWSRVEEPMAYLRQIMVNERVNLWRRLSSREFLAGVTGSWRLRDAPARDLAEDVAQRDEVLAALRGLPPRMRAVLVLRYWNDLSEAQIASTLNCSAGSVKSQLSRGLARLRRALSQPGDPPGNGPFPSDPIRPVGRQSDPQTSVGASGKV